MVAIENTIGDKLGNTLGLRPRVRLVEPQSIARSEGKAKRVVDNRRE